MSWPSLDLASYVSLALALTAAAASFLVARARALPAHEHRLPAPMEAVESFERKHGASAASVVSPANAVSDPSGFGAARTVGESGPSRSEGQAAP